jgi:hypothetical protein
MALTDPLIAGHNELSVVIQCPRVGSGVRPLLHPQHYVLQFFPDTTLTSYKKPDTDCRRRWHRALHVSVKRYAQLSLSNMQLSSLVLWEFCLRHPEVRDVCDIGQMLFWNKKWAWWATAVMFLLNNTVSVPNVLCMSNTDFLCL